MKPGLGLLLTLPALVAVMGTGCSDLCEGAACGGDDGGLEGGGSTDASIDGPAGDAAHDGGPISDGASSEAETSVPTCDMTADLAPQAACVTDALGVFVDGTNGADSNAGTKEQPFKTITKALAVGSASRVYVCAGTYTDNLTETSNAPVSIYGGFMCGTWAYAGTKAAISPASGVALTLKDVTGVTLEDLAITASASATAGDSTIGIFASGATIALSRVSVVAGEGTAGAQGAAGAATPNYTAPAKVGNPGNGSTPGAAVDCVCADGNTSHGGVGASSSSPTPGDGAASPVVGLPNHGATGPATCAAGTVGAAGVATTAGAASTSSGAVSSSGWTSADTRASGGNGNPAQGGGGGGAETNNNYGGGGGACGGCGGTGGGPGKNGGSSFAVLSYQSNLVLDDCQLTSQAGGPGGQGGAGEDGQAGGTGGSAACAGGPGGPGAGGSGGGGGAGGSSAAIAYFGTAPQMNNSTLTAGTPGLAGPAGMAGAGSGNGGATGGVGSVGAAGNMLVVSSK